jgi:hypothetical protein
VRQAKLPAGKHEGAVIVRHKTLVVKAELVSLEVQIDPCRFIVAPRDSEFHF